MDLKKIFIVIALSVSYDTFALELMIHAHETSLSQTITIVDSGNTNEIKDNEITQDQNTDIVKSEVSTTTFLRINYSEIELDEHAIRIAANCSPLESKGKFGHAIIDLDDTYFVIPTTPISLPPFPKDDGLDGLHGVDVNQNCVRDDIEHYIFEQFGETNQEQLRLYLYEYAIWLNFFLIDGISDQTAQAVTRQSIKVGNCIYANYSSVTSILDDLFANFHNTAERTEMFLGNMEVLSGYLLEGDIGSVC